MAYNKEYYEEHKEQLKENNKRYIERNKEKVNEKQRERYWNLSEEERQKRIIKQRENRAKNPELSRINYRIDAAKRTLKTYYTKYEELERKMFMLQMVDNWDSSDHKFFTELSREMHKLKEKIDLKNKQIAELLKDKEKLHGKVKK